MARPRNNELTRRDAEGSEKERARDGVRKRRDDGDDAVARSAVASAGFRKDFVQHKGGRA